MESQVEHGCKHERFDPRINSLMHLDTAKVVRKQTKFLSFKHTTSALSITFFPNSSLNLFLQRHKITRHQHLVRPQKRYGPRRIPPENFHVILLDVLHLLVSSQALQQRLRILVHVRFPKVPAKRSHRHGSLRNVHHSHVLLRWLRCFAF